MATAQRSSFPNGSRENHNESEYDSQFTNLWQLKLTAYLIIFAVSLAGNSLVIAVHALSFRHSTNTLKAASNYFLTNMAVADLIVTLFNIPMEIKTVLAGPMWLFSGTLGVVLCKCSISIWFLAVNVSTSTLAAIALDRFLLVFYPHKKIISKRAAYVLMALTWIIAFLFTVPLFTFTSIKVGPNADRICEPEFNWMRVYSILNFVVFILNPLIEMTILYSALTVKLWLRKPVVNHTSQSRDEKMNRKITVMLITIVLTFALCWLPFWISLIYCLHSASRSVSLSYQFNFVARFLVFCNSACNPFIYFSFSENFRQGAKDMWTKLLCFCRKRTRAEVSPTNQNVDPSAHEAMRDAAGNSGLNCDQLCERSFSTPELFSPAQA